MRLHIAFLFPLLASAAFNGSNSGSPVYGSAHFSTGLTTLSDSNYVSLPSGAFATGSSWTVEAWLNDTYSGSTPQVAIASGQQTNNIWLGIKNGRFFGSVNGSGPFSSGAAIDSTISIDDGNWHHCALVVSAGNTMYLFVDGALGSTTTGGSVNSISSTNGTIGRFGGTGYSWGGGIDEVVLWNYAKYTTSFTPNSSPYAGTEGMNALYHLDGTPSDSAVTGQVFYPNDAHILYSPYNWVVTGTAATTINSGAYFRTIFSGTSVSLQTNTANNGSPYSELWARVDGAPWGLLALAAGDPALNVTSGLPNRKHLLEVIVKSTSQTLSRWASNSQTMVTITGILCDSGASLTAPATRSRHILVFGDSITEGVLTKNNSAPADTDQNDVLGGYSYAIGQAYDAEIGIVGFGATGVNTSGSGGVPALTSSYGYVYSGAARGFSPAPDLVIYNEGTNDAGSIVAGLETVISGILAVAPASQHLILVPFNGTHTSDIGSVVAYFSSAQVASGNTSGFFSGSDSSDGIHPYDYAHLGLIAPQVFGLIDAVWP